MKKFLRYQNCIFFIAVILCMGFFACEKKKPKEVKIVRPVVTMTVISPESGRKRTFSGVAKSGIETDLSFRVSGKIIKLPAKVGMRVKKGQIIAKLDPTDFKLRSKESKADLAEAKANFTKLKADFERARLLFEAGNISKESLGTKRAMYKSAKAHLEASNQSLNLAMLKIKYTTLRSPKAGAIDKVPVNIYQAVDAGQTVAVLAVAGDMEFSIGVPETLIGRIKQGQKANLKFDAIPGKIYSVEVYKIGVGSVELSTYPVKLKIINADRKIRPGMIGEAAFRFSYDKNSALNLIPTQAVVGRPSGKPIVWVVDPKTMIVKSKEVKVGKVTTDGLQIEEGLDVGDILVIRGVHRLKENMKVKLMEKNTLGG